MEIKTPAELKALSDSTFFDNITGGIQSEKHREFNEALFASVAWATDLGSTEEQLTGEILNGNPVYVKRVNSGASLGYASTVEIAHGVANIDVNNVWIVHELSYGTFSGRKVQYPFINQIPAKSGSERYIDVSFTATNIVITNYWGTSGEPQPVTSPSIVIKYIKTS